MVLENIRIRFRKTGSLKYISHLDLCRTMCPAMIRAKIPLWYTEGFNPHPKMVFTQPLPLFVESECEFLDIKITENIPKDELCRKLRAAFTDELYVEEVYTPERKFQEIAYAGYVIKGLPEFSVQEFLAGEVKIIKKTKSGDKEIDIRPQIKKIELLEDANGDKFIFAVLNASGASYLNPDLLCRSICERFGETDYGIKRVTWFDEKMKEFR